MFDNDNEIIESLEPEGKPKRKLKLIIIIGLSVLVIVGIIIIIVVLSNQNKDGEENKDKIDGIQTKTSIVPLHEDILLENGHYLYDGYIFINYFRTNTNFSYFGVISDDGKYFQELYEGEYNITSKSNGIRTIPFRDNKRVYLGDYVFECNDTTKNISSCKKGILIPVNYPEKVVNNTNTYKTWSEMVVAPDNIHVAWTSLNTACGAVVFLGKFQRTENSYEIVESQIISTINFIEKAPTNETILLPQIPRGGEVKQFIDGGNALSLVGTLPNEFVKSIYQSLKTEEVYTFSHETGYDETTILSPDEKLGIAMSTRFSPNTSMGILGLMPRPYCILTLAKITENVYTYAVTNVRKYRKGNIGPALFDKEKSMNDPNYHGIDLHDKEDKFVFCSPISWHPSNLKALWCEIEKNGTKRRLKKLELSNYTPSSYPKIENTTDNVPYALNMSEMDNLKFETETNGIIKGKHSGYIEYYNSGISQAPQTVKLSYENYSDDGKKFYNGEEIYYGDRSNKFVYSSNVILSGSETGKNNFTITFDTDSNLIKNETEGFSTYGGKTIRAEDYEE